MKNNLKNIIFKNNIKITYFKKLFYLHIKQNYFNITKTN